MLQKPLVHCVLFKKAIFIQCEFELRSIYNCNLQHTRLLNSHWLMNWLICELIPFSKFSLIQCCVRCVLYSIFACCLTDFAPKCFSIVWWLVSNYKHEKMSLEFSTLLILLFSLKNDLYKMSAPLSVHLLFQFFWCISLLCSNQWIYWINSFYRLETMKKNHCNLCDKNVFFFLLSVVCIKWVEINFYESAIVIN